MVTDERAEDLRAIAEDVIADAELLKQLEARKRDREPGDPEADRLAAEAERLAHDIADKARIERKLTSDAKKRKPG